MPLMAPTKTPTAMPSGTAASQLSLSSVEVAEDAHEKPGDNGELIIERRARRRYDPPRRAPVTGRPTTAAATNP